MNGTFRIAAKTVHIWLGLAVGLPFCMMGLTGSLLVYRADIEKMLRPNWHAHSTTRSPQPLSEAERNIKARFPNSTLQHVSLSEFEFTIRDRGKQTHVYCDPLTGELLGTFKVPWLDWRVGLHHNLRLGPAGRQIVGAIGIALFLTSISGLALWLWRGVLRNGTWRSVFQIDWRRRKTANFQLHRLSGLAANVFLLILSSTGIVLGFPQTFRSLVKEPTRVTVEKVGERLPLEMLLQSALREIPGGQAKELRLPQNNAAPVTVRIWHAGDFRPEGSNQVSLNPSTAAVLSVDRSADWSTAKRIVMSPTPIHYAEWGGGIVKALWCVTGIAPTLLFLSGFAIWWMGFRAAKRAPKQVSQAVLTAQ